ncbi:hypothetical protein [Pseudokineococcus lusitanus]|nr:hypothetical protein [Pseudokineococcus lusitanus]
MADEPEPEVLPGAADWLATWMHVRAWAGSRDDAMRVMAGFRASVEGPFGGEHPTLPDAIEAYLTAADAGALVPCFGND